MKSGIKAAMLCAALFAAAIARGQADNGGELFTLVSADQCKKDCDSDLFKNVWVNFEDSTGLRTAVDTASVRYGDAGGFQVVIYTGQPKRMFDAGKLQRLFFNCQGQYQDLTRFPSQLEQFGPRSVGGAIERKYCQGNGR